MAPDDEIETRPSKEREKDQSRERERDHYSPRESLATEEIQDRSAAVSYDVALACN